MQLQRLRQLASLLLPVKAISTVIGQFTRGSGGAA
jgi:hypothetical protein